MSKELDDIVKVITGEMALEKKEKALKEAKKQAVENEKNLRRKNIVKGNVKLEDDPIVDKKVVQNIKLFEWSAPDRYEFSLNKKTFLILVALCLVLILFLAILQHYMLMVSIIALLFLIYVLGTTKPLLVKHLITARGIETGNKLYEWFTLKNFYFTKKDDVYFMIVETNLRFPGALIFLLDEKDKNPIFVLLQDKLLYKDIRKQSSLDKLNYGDYIPLEKI